MTLRAAAFCFALMLTACSGSAYKKAAREDTIETYRRFLTEHPGHDAADLARARLAELEFEEATRIHTIVAYKRFIDEFPDSPKARAAQSRLEALRFNLAKAQGAPAALREFASDHPDGAHADEARRLLAEREFGALGDKAAAKDVSTVVASYPEDKRSDEARRLLDQRAYAEAKQRGAASLLGYLRDFPAGAHRDEARAELLSLKLEGLLFSGLCEEARLEAARSPLVARIPDLSKRIAQAETMRRLRAGKEPAARVVMPEHYLRDIDALERALESADPMDAWEAAYELGQHVSVRVIDPLLRVVRRAAANPLIRFRALEGLANVMGALPAKVADYEAAVRLEELRASAASPELYLSIAVLLDLTGDAEGAAREYQKAFEPEVPDPLVLRRWMTLRQRASRHFSSAVVGRQLAVWAEQLARDVDVSASVHLITVRRLCAATVLARDAHAGILEAQRHTTEFPEDLVQFGRLAERSATMAGARLRDAELALASKGTRFRRCDDPALAERLASADKGRVEGLDKLRSALPVLAPKLLQAVVERDPSPAVRERARALLGSAHVE